jgi:plasmid stability protein
MATGRGAPRQYTIRNVPAAVDRALRQRAARSHRSLNDVALEALAQAAQVSVPGTADLEAFFGSWVEDPEVDEALAEQRKVDEDLWR